jgi:hypothetical protein
MWSDVSLQRKTALQITLGLLEKTRNKTPSTPQDHNGTALKGVGETVVEEAGTQVEMMIGAVTLGPGCFPKQVGANVVKVQQSQGSRVLHDASLEQDGIGGRRKPMTVLLLMISQTHTVDKDDHAKDQEKYELSIEAAAS